MCQNTMRRVQFVWKTQNLNWVEQAVTNTQKNAKAKVSNPSRVPEPNRVPDRDRVTEPECGRDPEPECNRDPEHECNRDRIRYLESE